MKTAIIGCGYVADYYMLTLHGHRELELVAAHDRDESRRLAFQKNYGVPVHESLEQLLRDQSVELVLNLTNPRSHAAITRASLESGKHVYSEKPLGMTTLEARELAACARTHGLQLASAPCSVLGETAQTMWKALRDGLIGKVRLVVANFDDDLIAPQLKPWGWRSPVGTHWPAKDEFEVGCTYEHAGYFLSWLAAFFGPARRVTSFASTQIPDKGIAVDQMAPDFMAGCIEYDDGMVARVTCSLIAPHDRSRAIIGDDGVLHTRSLRDDAAPVYWRREPPGDRQASLEKRVNQFQQWLERNLPRIPWSWHEWRLRRQLPYARKPSPHIPRGAKRVDFCRGPLELIASIREARPCRLSAELGVHMVELVEALQHPERSGGVTTITSTFPAIEPLPCD